MEIQLIRKLVRLMSGADLSELEVEDRESGLRVHLKRGGEAPTTAPLVSVMQGGTGAVSDSGSAKPVAGAPAEPDGIDIPPGTSPFLSPMVGTFYRSPSPEAAWFVEAGSKIGPDTVLCIIEAMKVMNEIKAETKGEIVEILVENGEPVEYGQPLFLIKTA